MTKLGIIGAMAVEVAYLKDQMQEMKIVKRAGMTFYEGLLDGRNVVVVECGIGKVNAALCVQILCDCFGITHVVNTGVAGSLCAELDIGDFVISTDAVYHDFDCSAVNPNYIVGQIPGFPVREFTADEQLVNIAFEAAQTVHNGHVRKGTVASGDQFVGDKAKKAGIVETTGALCTEMEGAAIAHAAWRNGIPFVVIRAISDKADDSAEMDYPTFEAIAAKQCAAVTRLMSQKI